MRLRDDTPNFARIGYDLALGVAAGLAVGWFGWVFLPRLVDGGVETPYWPFAFAGIVLVVTIIRSGRTRSKSADPRWIHLLWIPVVLFLVMMIGIIMALRSFQ